MKEFKNIIDEYEKVRGGQRLALATVVKVRGSSYRSPGARMLIRNDGRWTGSISGGCLEGDALRKAKEVMRSNAPKVVTYDTMDDSDNNLGVGLGCNGIIDVLIEPINEVGDNPLIKLKAYTEIDDLAVLATVFRAEHFPGLVGRQLWFDQKELRGDIPDEQLSALIEEEILRVVDNRKPAIKSFLKDTVEVFFEIIEPSIDLQIYGGGFDAKPVVELAKVLGWSVTVSDECIAHVAPANFPLADKVSLCKRDQRDGDIIIKPYTATVLMSHSYDYDLAILKKLLPTAVRYIGILGPKKRLDKMFAELQKEGIKLTTADNHRIHSPVGLDIGAETPEEIALSIITEVQAKFTNRSGGFLKYRKAPIHQRDGKEDQVFKQVFINDFDQKKAQNE